MFDPFLPSRIPPEEWPERLKKSNTDNKRMELLAGVHFAGCDEKTWSDLCEAVSSECKNDPKLAAKIEICSTGANPSSRMLLSQSDAVACHVSGMPRSAPVITWLVRNLLSNTATIQARSTLHFLLWAGFDPNAQDDDGNAALHLIVGGDSLLLNDSAIEMLLDAGAKVDIKNKNGETPGLLLAKREGFTSGSISTWNRFEDRGEDFSAKGRDGFTIRDRLAAVELRKPNEAREALIEYIDSLMEED